MVTGSYYNLDFINKLEDTSVDTSNTHNILSIGQIHLKIKFFHDHILLK